MISNIKKTGKQTNFTYETEFLQTEVSYFTWGTCLYVTPGSSREHFSLSFSIPEG